MSLRCVEVVVEGGSLFFGRIRCVSMICDCLLEDVTAV
jgi:hypothetical protein